MNVERELIHFVRSELVKERKTGKFTGFVLRHAAPGSKGNEVDSWDLSDEQLTLDDANRLANEIGNRAQIDANGNGPGPQRYVLSSVVEGGRAARLAFVLRGESQDEEEEDPNSAGNDPPTMRGLVQQQMRHNEALARTLIQVSSTAGSHMARQLEAMGRQVESMLKDRFDMFEQLEQSRNANNEREIAVMQALNKEKHKEAAVEKMLALAPAVVNRLTGKSVVEDAQDPLKMMFKDFATSLSPEQLRAIGASLNPTQQIQMVELLRSAQQAEKGDKK